MAIAQTFSMALGRELSVEEADLTQQLSPHGVAKINADIAQGANLEQTLAELKVVLQASQKRKALAQSFLPEEMLPVVRHMKRPLTAEEMVLITGTSAAVLHHEIALRTKKGEALEDVVQELAEEHRQRLLQASARRLADEEGKVVFVTPLSPTVLDSAHPYGLTVSVTEVKGKSEILRLGLGPMVTWFTELEPLNESLGPCTLRSESTPSQRSTLKKRISLLGTSEVDSLATFSLGYRSSASARGEVNSCGASFTLTTARCSRAEDIHVSFGATVVIGEAAIVPESAPLSPLQTSSAGSPRKRRLLGGTGAVVPAREIDLSQKYGRSPEPKRSGKRPPVLTRLFACLRASTQSQAHPATSNP